MKQHRFFLFIFFGIVGVYLATLQTIPNGSSHPYMIDVGETQIAINIWGVLHATGYPLYTILGNLLSPLPQAIGANPATAASFTSFVWTAIALGWLYSWLQTHTQTRWSAALGVLSIAFAQSIWIHSVVAEVYSMSLAILIGLWWIAFAPNGWTFEQRFLGLAFLGGIGISHHRAIAFAGLGLVFAIWDDLKQHWQQLPRLLLMGIPLFLLGFLPYGYVVLRATANAEWLYADDLNTWDGFWFLFMGREADYLVTTPSDLDGWIENLEGTLTILINEVTLVGLWGALLALGWALWQSPHTRIIRGVTLSVLGFLVWAISYHQAVLPEAILMMILPCFSVALAFTLDDLSQRNQWFGIGVGALTTIIALLLIPIHIDFIQALTDDPTGQQSIAAAQDIPRTNPLEEPVLMLSWGPRYFAASYSRFVTDENVDLLMVDHTANFTDLVQHQGKTIYTEPDTLFGYSLAWWQERIGTVYLNSVGGNMIRLATEPLLVEDIPLENRINLDTDLWLVGAELSCDDNEYEMALGWYATEDIEQNFSIKVHLVSDTSVIPLIQADSSAPVHGWRPTSTLLKNELIQDHYQLPHHPNATRVIVGLYEGLGDGTFINYGDTAVTLPACNF